MSDYAARAISIMDDACASYEYARDPEGIASAILDAARAIVFAILSLKEQK